MTTTGVLPDAAFVVALSLLPGCGQQRLRSLLSLGSPPELWAALCRGSLGAASARWRALAARIDVGAAWKTIDDNHAGVWVWGDADYPAALCDDPDPPPILYRQGDVAALGRPSVAIIGTRRCTSYGADVARQLGRDLAAAGVTVVSGLALGVDGAAHEGALAAAFRHEPSLGDGFVTESNRGGAPPIAVVGSGLDVVYPSRHRSLWCRVRERGLLLTEAPFGAAPEAWRFPLRNRIIAGLAQVVVVVESHAAGGSMSTVRWAIERGIPVMAVPGSVRSPSSVGTNRLLAEGVAPVTDAQDVLVALSLEGSVVGTPARSPAPTPTETGAEPSYDSVLAAVEWTPTSTEDVLRRTGLSLGEASRALTQLECSGHLARRGGWWERVG